MRLILASSSPRRRELLEKAGLAFDVIPSRGEEIHDENLGMEALCMENAKIKAMDVAVQYPDAVVIGADTLVFLSQVPLGKPKNLDEAKSMLIRLSGRSHQVCTGVCISRDQEVRTFSCTTEVEFRELNEAMIQDYLATTQPLDKAGGYGIQDHGERIVSQITGSYENVMGLPVEMVVAALQGMELPIGER
ncbi:MAG: nucleoside triphosphate pyrophosphatase [Akkermansiaceae bacterium]